jgi:hypothetical protein
MHHCGCHGRAGTQATPTALTKPRGVWMEAVVSGGGGRPFPTLGPLPAPTAQSNLVMARGVHPEASQPQGDRYGSPRSPFASLTRLWAIQGRVVRSAAVGAVFVQKNALQKCRARCTSPSFASHRLESQTFPCADQQDGAFRLCSRGWWGRALLQQAVGGCCCTPNGGLWAVLGLSETQGAHIEVFCRPSAPLAGAAQ